MNMGEGINTVNIILDVVLVLASLWMVFTARGIGGLVGRSLNLIVAGAIVLGIAHLIATFAGPGQLAVVDGPTNNFVHRLIVLAGFILLVFGFRQIRVMKD
jgi:hypothetical protein